MASPEIDVRYVADLARLDLTDAEAATFQKQLSSILGYVAQLEKVDVSGVPAFSGPVVNNLREDVAGESLPVEVALSNAPKQDNNLIVVPKMIE
jgi:aspartyl-tRNA(Asn)/glutamyl-tRNA(Gln) amidotransferase subunit C